MMQAVTTSREYKLFCLFGAIGGGARGFVKACAQLGNLRAHFRSIGSVDVDVAANRDYKRLVGSEATTLDLFSRDQYIDFWGKNPPNDWREATPEDIRKAAGGERPDSVFLSPPCKGFSGLLSASKSRSARYQALNRLTLRGIWLTLEAWRYDPPEFLILENVPRCQSRGKILIAQIVSMLRHYGYAVRESVHDCGELAGLAQSRKRFLLVARHTEKVANFLYEPPKKPLRGVGEVIGKLPLPGESHPMHRVPSLMWSTWCRLAMIEPGKDWRSLNRLRIKDGVLQDYLIVPDVRGIATSPNSSDVGSLLTQASNQADLLVANMSDPRFAASERWKDGQAYGVRRWDQHVGAVTGQKSPGQGSYSVADPRCPSTKHNNCFRVVPWTHPAGTVTGGGHPSSGGQGLADPRPGSQAFAKYSVTRWSEASGTVISGSTTGQGAFAVADPRSGLSDDRAHYKTGGHYGVVGWEQSCGAISSSACHDNGRWSVADPRVADVLPNARDHLVAVIISEGGNWHRPFTTLELAALQSLFDVDDPTEVQAFSLDGSSDSAWRERIGNAVPPNAAEAIASEVLKMLLLAETGERAQLSKTPIWVRPLAASMQLTHTTDCVQP